MNFCNSLQGRCELLGALRRKKTLHFLEQWCSKLRKKNRGTSGAEDSSYTSGERHDWSRTENSAELENTVRASNFTSLLNEKLFYWMKYNNKKWEACPNLRTCLEYCHCALPYEFWRSVLSTLFKLASLCVMEQREAKRFLFSENKEQAWVARTQTN